jgi:hypothetical protein
MVLIAGVALFAFVLGYVIATAAGDASQQDLEQGRRFLEIENQRLKRGQ